MPVILLSEYKSLISVLIEFVKGSSAFPKIFVAIVEAFNSGSRTPRRTGAEFVRADASIFFVFDGIDPIL